MNFRLLFIALFFLVLNLGLITVCYAMDVTLQWDPNSEPTIAGYKVYYTADSSTPPFDGAGAVQGPSPVDAMNLTSATFNGLDPNRTYYFAVTAYDTAGNESSYSNVVAALESIAPTVSFASPLPGANVSGVVSVNISASDNVGVTKVELSVNGTLFATTTSAPFNFSWDTTALTNGVYSLGAMAYDAAGNVGQSSSVTVTVNKDTTAPVISITAPGNNSTVSGTVGVIASASDNIGVSKVEIYVNNVLRSVMNTPPYSFNWDTKVEVNGLYTIIAKAFDTSGNMGQSASTALTVSNQAVSAHTGNVDGDNVVTVADALIVLRAALDPALQTLVIKTSGDVWPLDTSGKPQGDGIIDINDARLILQKTVGTVTW